MESRHGRPSPDSTIISLRLPNHQLARLDHYMRVLEERTGLKANRNLAMRRALDEWLDRQEKAMDIPPPESTAPKHPSAPKKRTTGKKSIPPKRRRNDAQTSDPDDAC